MSDKCTFCNGTGVEPGHKACVWCESTGRTLTMADYLSPELAKAPCRGMNCGIIPGTGQPHSPECLAQHAAAAAGGEFFKLEACTGNTRKRRERWVFNIRAVLDAGVPDTLRPNLEYTVQEIERSMKYGGTQSLREEVARLRAAAPQPPVGDEIAGYLHRVLEKPTFYAADNIHIVDGMPLYLESAVTARDQQIAALQARVAELEKDAARYQFLRDGDRGGLEYWDDELVVCGDEDTLFGKALDGAVDNGIEAMNERLAEQVTKS